MQKNATPLTDERQYRFHDLLDSSRSHFSERLDALAQAMEITPSTLYRYMRATWTTPVDVPVTRLAKAAKHLGLTINDLINLPNDDSSK